MTNEEFTRKGDTNCRRSMTDRKRERTCEQEGEREKRVSKRAREEAEKFHHRFDDVGGRQRVGRFMGEKNAEGTGS